MKSTRSLPLIAGLTLSCLASIHPLSASATIDESAVTRTVIVSPDGTGDYGTLGEAFRFLNENPELAVKVSIQPGTYREPPTNLEPRNAAATIIEGASAGEVILSGADIWEDWQDEGDGLFSKPWPYDWGLATYDNNYVIRDDLGRRSEIVLWNGERLRQVAAKEDLSGGCFFVDEAADKLWLRPPAGDAPDAAVIEVGVRPQVLSFRQVNNLVLRNLTVRDAPNGPQHGSNRFSVALFGNDYALDMEDQGNISRNLLIDGCTFVGNGTGPTMTNYAHATITNSQFNDNGTAGAGISRFRWLEVLDCEFNRNNWRIGGYGKFFDWAPAGVKFLKCGDMSIHDSVFNDNLAPGLWLDFQIENVLVDKVVATGNGGPGIYIEASNGPFVVSNSVFNNNGTLTYGGTNHGGVLIAEARNVTVTGCEIKDNSHGAVVIRTREREGCGGFFSGMRFDGSVKNIALVNNRISGATIRPAPDAREMDWYGPAKQSGGLIMMSTHSNPEFYRDTFLPTLYADANVYHHPDSEAVFSNGGDYGFERLTLKEWRKAYGQDGNSRWEP